MDDAKAEMKTERVTAVVQTEGERGEDFLRELAKPLISGSAGESIIGSLP